MILEWIDRINSNENNSKIGNLPPLHPPVQWLRNEHLFKLTNGSLARQSFDGAALLESLYKFVADQETGSGHPMGSDEHICLVSAFPRRTFGPEEGQISVQDA
ncbi:unnamed protein product, partial [Absidia cylindrospora]